MVTRISTYTAQEYLIEEAHGSEMPACTLFPSYVPWHWVCTTSTCTLLVWCLKAPIRSLWVEVPADCYLKATQTSGMTWSLLFLSLMHVNQAAPLL